MIPIPERRIAAFESLGFGMFIHYGLYSQLGKGEWVMNRFKIPPDEYSELKDTFTASGFDAGKIARLAKTAGMKYITLTTRHHEGFSLYDTCGLNDFDAPHAPNCGRDLVREFVDACRAEGIVPMFYHTTLDWRDPRFENDFKAYLQYLRDSVEILCTRYGPIGGFWFDGNWSKKGADWEEDALYGLIRKHQPEAMIINNTGLDARGAAGNPQLDSVTFEQGRPTPMNREGMPKYLAAEMCCTMNDHWGVGAGDFNYKSLPELIESLCACRKVGANFLLNVGPAADGSILPLQRALLEEIGNWIRTCGAGLYEGRPCRAVGEGKNFALQSGNRLWLYLYGLGIHGNKHVTVGACGEGYKHFTGVPGKVKRIFYTDNGEELRFLQQDGDLFVYTPACPYGSNYPVRTAEAEMEE